MIILQRTIRKARGKHCARIRYEDDNGKTREVLGSAESKSDAKMKLAELEVEILKKGTARLEAGKVTFRQLAEYVKTRFYVPATYSEDGSKVSGVRSVKAAHYAIDKLVEYFGDKDIGKIDEAFEKYKAHRLKTVCIATVNRELSKARKMFGVALSKKWVFDHPFKTEAGKQLIQVAAEKRAMEHVLSEAEELRLFTALQKADRRHTIPVFIAALETGARWSSLVLCPVALFATYCGTLRNNPRSEISTERLVTKTGRVIKFAFALEVVNHNCSLELFVSLNSS